jgi:hypothetical protein
MICLQRTAQVGNSDEFPFLTGLFVLLIDQLSGGHDVHTDPDGHLVAKDN